MVIRTLLIMSLLGFSLVRPAEAQEAMAKVDARLEVVARYEKACRYVYASQPTLTANLYAADAGSVTENCECAAMLTVSKFSDSDLATAGEEAAHQRYAALVANIALCSSLPKH